MSEKEIENILSKIKELERRVLELEVLNNKKKRTRPLKWQEKILLSIDSINRPARKGEILKRVSDTHPHILSSIKKTTVKNRLSSSYAKMVKDEKLVLITSDDKDFEDRYALKDWFNKTDRHFNPIQRWFAENSEYKYPRF